MDQVSSGWRSFKKFIEVGVCVVVVVVVGQSWNTTEQESVWPQWCSGGLKGQCLIPVFASSQPSVKLVYDGLPILLHSVPELEMLMMDVPLGVLFCKGKIMEHAGQQSICLRMESRLSAVSELEVLRMLN